MNLRIFVNSLIIDKIIFFFFPLQAGILNKKLDVFVFAVKFHLFKTVNKFKLLISVKHRNHL